MLLLAIDEGTSSARAIVFTPEGQVVGIGRRPVPLSYPHPGWVEQDPEALWQAQYEAVQEALQAASVLPNRIVAVGLTNQRETMVAWDRSTGRPYGPAIVWQDRRTAPYCEALQPQKALLRQKTGLLPDPYFSATKIQWMLREGGVPPTAHFGTVDSWLLFKMTGQARTDASNASRTLLFDLHTLSWDAGLCELFGVSLPSLPPVQPSGSFFGETSLWGARWPILAVLGDQQAALYGHGAFEAGQTKCTYGTGAFVLKNIGSTPLPSPEGLLTTVAWQKEGRPPVYAWEAAIFSAAAALQWLEKLGLLADYRELDSLEGSAGEVFFVPAFTGLGTPYWDPYARGLIIGLERDTDRQTLLLAALEAIAYQTADALELFGDISELRVDGGVSQNDLLMQLQADLTGRRVLRPAHGEVTAWGAAALAGRQAGLPVQPLKAIAHWEPRPRPHALDRWREAVRRAQGWARPTP